MDEEISTPPVPVDESQRHWAMFAHLSAILGGLLTGHVGGIGCILGPLIIWQVKKDSMPFVAEQAKEALNFNITVGIVLFVLFLLGIGTLGIGFILTAPLMGIVAIAALAFIIIAAVKANAGVAYRYPFTFRLIK